MFLRIHEPSLGTTGHKVVVVVKGYSFHRPHVGECAKLNWKKQGHKVDSLHDKEAGPSVHCYYPTINPNGSVTSVSERGKPYLARTAACSTAAALCRSRHVGPWRQTRHARQTRRAAKWRHADCAVRRATSSAWHWRCAARAAAAASCPCHGFGCFRDREREREGERAREGTH